ncbi:hypothetical protein [Lentzea sp. NPDC092896]|uniref:hypothetical protein n=1 Tax=Lentzea sp. NPDC092896 TaxID=3364127 RepID=UPI00380ABC67
MQNGQIEIHEDNSGAVYLTRGSETWGLGPVTIDMKARAADDAQGWANNDWEPNEHDGQVRADLTGLEHIATWHPGGMVIEHDHHDNPVAGAGGASYLGLDR